MRAFISAVLAAGFVGCVSFGGKVEDEAPLPLEDATDASQEAKPPADGGVPDGAPDDAGLDDGALDAAPDVIVPPLPVTWSSPNGATWSSDAKGTRITGFGTYNHPVILPLPQLAASADSYTAHAIVRSPAAAAQSGEFGILARIQSDGAGVVLGSMYGGQPTPFITSLGPPSWNPVASAGTGYSYVADARYEMKLQVVGAAASGKLWLAGTTEPATWMAKGTSPWMTGDGVGFYSYGVNGAVLEKLWVTVP